MPCTEACRTWASTVTSSPSVRLRRSLSSVPETYRRGRCSIRSPTVRSFSDSNALAVLPPSTPLRGTASRVKPVVRQNWAGGRSAVAGGSAAGFFLVVFFAARRGQLRDEPQVPVHSRPTSRG